MHEVDTELFRDFREPRLVACRFRRCGGGTDRPCGARLRHPLARIRRLFLSTIRCHHNHRCQQQESRLVAKPLRPSIRAGRATYRRKVAVWSIITASLHCFVHVFATNLAIPITPAGETLLASPASKSTSVGSTLATLSGTPGGPPRTNPYSFVGRNPQRQLRQDCGTDFPVRLDRLEGGGTRVRKTFRRCRRCENPGAPGSHQLRLHGLPCLPALSAAG